MTVIEQIEGYDIIGDVHGCALTLEQLLSDLGYRQDSHESDGPAGNESAGSEKTAYRHPSRQVIFLGDIVDRGPRIREALHIVKNMVDAGSAQCILGNHEYNALAYTTPTAESEGTDSVEYVRPHNARHNLLISDTLMQFASYPEEWRMFLDWFRSLPVYLDFDDFRVVHACWDAQLIEEFNAKGLSPLFDKAFLQRSSNHGSIEARFIDRLTRGTDMRLPKGRWILGRDGYERRIFRTKFWAENPETFRDVVFQPDPLPVDIAALTLTEENKRSLIYYGSDEKPVFVGHYWLENKPSPLRDNIACLDYSAVKYGRLVAYRFDGESCLDESKFEWVDVEQDHKSSERA